MAILTKQLEGLGWDDLRFSYPNTDTINGIIKGLKKDYGISLSIYPKESDFFKKFDSKKDTNFSTLDFLLLDIIDAAGNELNGYRIASQCRALGFHKPIFLFSSRPEVFAHRDFFPVHPFMFISKSTPPETIVLLIKGFLQYNHLTQDTIFIGHGGKSLEWQKLANFLTGKKLKYDEFNRTSQAGNQIPIRLMEMKEQAGLAFIIYSKEDEQQDKAERARQNVIHESGFFQAALGYEKTILFVERGCQIQSNIDGIIWLNYSTSVLEKEKDILEILKRERFIIPNA